MPFDTHPVVERLQRQVQVGATPSVRRRRAARCDPPPAGRACRARRRRTRAPGHRSGRGSSVASRVSMSRARLRFQPRLGILAVERVSRDRVAGRARAIELFGEALDFAASGARGRGARSLSPKRRSPPASSANSMPRTRRLVRPSCLANALHAGERGDRAASVRRCWARDGGRARGAYRDCRSRGDRRASRNRRAV